MTSSGETRTAAVIGGGIGGLAAAIGLLRTGWQVTVWERATELPTAGTGLGMWPSALRALDRLGLGAQAREIGRPQESGAIRRPDGSVIAKVDIDKVVRKFGEPVRLLTRPELLRLLASELPAGTVRFGSPASLSSGDWAGYDLVVGADGINSQVRQVLFGQRHALRYCGWTVWRGTCALDVPSGGETWGRGPSWGSRRRVRD